MTPARYLITAPDDDVVSLADAKLHLGVTTSDKDALIQIMIDAVVAQFDPAGGGWLGRALRPQTWEIRMEGFPGVYYEASLYRRDWRSVAKIELPYPPLLLVDSVKYDDGDGVEQTLVEDTNYRVFGVGGRDKAYILPTYNGAWPTSVRCDAESVRVRFTCGYEPATVDEMPASIKQAVLLSISHLWSLAERNLFLAGQDIPGVISRRWVVSEAPGAVLKAAAEHLLAPLRVYE